MKKKMKSKKGFTLVEIVVVLVILAILAAIAIPAYTGYISKANDRALLAEARTVLMAAQTICSEAFASKATVDVAVIQTLAETPAANHIKVTYNGSYKVTELIYSNGTKQAKYASGAWGAVEASTITADAIATVTP